MFYPDAYWAKPANFESRLSVALLKGDARRRDCDELRIDARPIAPAPLSRAVGAISLGKPDCRDGNGHAGTPFVGAEPSRTSSTERLEENRQRVRYVCASNRLQLFSRSRGEVLRPGAVAMRAQRLRSHELREQEVRMVGLEPRVQIGFSARHQRIRQRDIAGANARQRFGQLRLGLLDRVIRRRTEKFPGLVRRSRRLCETARRLQGACEIQELRRVPRSAILAKLLLYRQLVQQDERFVFFAGKDQCECKTALDRCNFRSRQP